MTSPSRSFPPVPLQTTKALSLDKSDSLSQSVSIVSDTGSAGSTLTLENLRLNPARLLTPPWSTEDTPSISHESGDMGQLGHHGQHPTVQSPGWSSAYSDTDSMGLQLSWARVPLWDCSRSAPHPTFPMLSLLLPCYQLL